MISIWRLAKAKLVGFSPNGAEKTTDVLHPGRLAQPDSGAFLLTGRHHRLPMYPGLASGISYLPQEHFGFPPLTVRRKLAAVLETLPLTAQQQVTGWRIVGADELETVRYNELILVGR